MFTQYYNKDNSYIIHQGEAGPICFTFTDSDGELITPGGTFMDMSISIGKCEKRYSRNPQQEDKEIKFDTATKQWIYFLTQADSFRLPVGKVPVEVYIKLSNTMIPVVSMEPIEVVPTYNKVVL